MIILVVEDEYSIRILLSDLITTMEEYEVVTASSVEQALEILRITNVAFVISDINLPVKNGFKFFREVQTTWPHLVNKFVFLSGNADVFQDEAKKLGLPIFCKPISHDSLQKILERAQS